jgi:uncharacterized protein (TIGR00369 family)
VSAAREGAPPIRAVDSARAVGETAPHRTRRREIVWQDPMVAFEGAAGKDGIELMGELMRGDLPPPPIAVVMRMTAAEVGVGRAVFEGEPGEEHYNPIGAVHGGYASTILDSALGCAVHTTLPAGAAYTTLTLEVKFVRPITRDTGQVRAEAEVVHRGRRQATAEGRLIAAGSGKLLAHGTATCLILGGEEAATP